MVVYQLVATGTEQHKVVYIVDVLRPRPFMSPWPTCLEGHHMGSLGEVALGQGEVVFQEVAVAPVELAPPACTNTEQNPQQRTQGACMPNQRRRILIARRGSLSEARTHISSQELT